MIAETDVDTALSYLRKSADEAAVCRANVTYLKEWIKTEKARCAMKHAGLSAAAADTQALVDPEYKLALEALRTAVEDDAKHAFKREAADALIRAYQTQEATKRTENRAYG